MRDTARTGRALARRPPPVHDDAREPPSGHANRDVACASRARDWGEGKSTRRHAESPQACVWRSAARVPCGDHPESPPSADGVPGEREWRGSLEPEPCHCQAIKFCEAAPAHRTAAHRTPSIQQWWARPWPSSSLQCLPYWRRTKPNRGTTRLSSRGRGVRGRHGGPGVLHLLWTASRGRGGPRSRLFVPRRRRDSRVVLWRRRRSPARRWARL